MGKIGDLPGRANTATAAPKHSDAITIGNFAVAGDDCGWEESFLVSLRKLHALHHFLERINGVVF